jgi:hypothetical protein
VSTCADLREDLALHAHGLLDGAEAAAVESHVAACEPCSRELSELRATLAVVRTLPEIEPTAAETDALFDAVEAELEAGRAPVHQLSGWRRSWEQAVWRYENSTRFRRITLASIGLHAAAAAGIAWLLVGGDGLTRRPQIAYELQEQIAELEEDTQRALEDATARTHRAEPDDYVAGDPLPYDPATPEGVLLPPVMDPGGMRARDEIVRAPTVGILVRLRAVIDEEYRSETLSERLDATLVPRVDAAVADGLAWLATRRADDGRWGPEPSADGEDVRDGVTAAVVLAFVQNGHSAREGEHAGTLGPAIAALASRLRDGAAARDLKPVYSHALALRALAWEWALDFRHLSADERVARRELLAGSARELLKTQHANGGFGYRADDRPDASCTLFVAGALADLRLAGVLRADEELQRAGAYLQALRGSGSHQAYREAGDRDGDPALTAGVLVYARELGIHGDLSPQMRVVREALVKPHSPDALLAWSGLQILRHRDGINPALARLLDRQRDDGRWRAATDRHCRVGGDDLTTAMGVLAVSRVYMP